MTTTLRTRRIGRGGVRPAAEPLQGRAAGISNETAR